MPLNPLHDEHDGPWGVSRCDCGVYRVKLGALVLELDQEDFQQLVTLLKMASEHFEGELLPGPTRLVAH